MTPVEPAAPDTPLTPGLPSSFGDKLWVRVRTDITLAELASQLRVQETTLAKLNDVNEDHGFSPGDWVVLPSQKASAAKQLASLDTSELRRSAPRIEPLPVEGTGVVRFGDNLVKLAQRYRLSIQDLLRLNPGLEAARLVEGRQIRVARARPTRSRMVLGLKPTGSGGLSWPDLPGFDPVPQTRPRRFDQSLDDMVRQGVVTPGERSRVQSSGALRPGELSAHQQVCSNDALSEQECRTGVSVRWRRSNSLKAERLDNDGKAIGALMVGMGRIDNSYRAPVRDWQTFGTLRVDWASWRKSSSGTRIADARGSASQVAVHCNDLTIAAYSNGRWGRYEAAEGPMSQLVFKLCDNRQE
ncbi:LysM domain-containing protein [Synechococcus sp. BSF8S]|nr:LysM domain-containing protein [Synechococcus sp. BSF8S]